NGVEDVAEEVEADVIAEFVAAAQADAADGAGPADFEFGQKGRAAVDAHRAPQLHAVVRSAVAGVVPNDGDVAGGRIESDLGKELAIRAEIGVHAHRGAPGGPVVVREAREDVRVRSRGGGPIGVDHV